MPVTAVVYEWNVSTTKPWMNLLAPIARPLFAWNHDWVMRNGGPASRRCSAAVSWRRLSRERPRLLIAESSDSDLS